MNRLGFFLALVASGFAAGAYIIWYVDSGLSTFMTGIVETSGSVAVANLAFAIALGSTIAAAYCWLMALDYA